MNLKSIGMTHGLDKLNTLTKYPSIQTYHTIDKGRLKETLTFDEVFPADSLVYLTEKVDGTNGRIVVCNGEYLIGSRDEFLYYSNDWLCTNTLNIVTVMKPYAEVLSSKLPKDDKIYIFYGEVYGGKINNGNMYTRSSKYGLRFFDVVVLEDISMLNMKIESLAGWREHGGQTFLSVSDMKAMILNMGYSEEDIVPYIKIVNGQEIPTTVDEAYDWLKQFEKSTAILDDDYFDDVRPGGKAEGIVARLEDRSLIRKLRFEDYQKTLKHRS